MALTAGFYGIFSGDGKDYFIVKQLNVISCIRRITLGLWRLAADGKAPNVRCAVRAAGACREAV